MNDLLKIYNIDKNIYELANKCEEELKEEFKRIDNLEFQNSLNVLSAFKEENLNESDFATTTGYGYGDIGRDKIERIFAKILKGEDSLVRSQIISGTHALTITLFGLLRPGDIMLSISGTPYDTLEEVIGIKENENSLKSFNINYEEIDLINDFFDTEKIKETLKRKKIKLIEIQRSKGYSKRKSISIEKIKEVIKSIREVDKEVIIMIDNCYCEFVESITPLEVGADIMVGSLIKNLGGGIATNGGYVAGKKNLIDKVAQRLNPPGEGKEVGPSMGANREILLGIYSAPKVVASSLKVSALASCMLEKLHYKVEPKYNEHKVDIVLSIKFGNEKDLISYCEGIQLSSAIDSNSLPIPTSMPGYDDKIIMASGSFTQGSSIEISCDGPLRKPYIAYMQGSLSYAYGKIAVLSAISRVVNNK